MSDHNPAVDGYRKIPGPFVRDPETHKIRAWEYVDSTIEYLAPLMWAFNEKVDGTNIRVMWDGHNVTLGGRTAKAEIPKPLGKRLHELFCTDEAEELFEQNYGAKPTVLIGEGYGAGIQKGGRYRDTPDFVLFDVWQDWYLDRGELDEHAAAFGVRWCEPFVKVPLRDMIAEMHSGWSFKSIIADKPDTVPEGLVGQPTAPIRDKYGKQLAVKLKPSNIGSISTPGTDDA